MSRIEFTSTNTLPYTSNGITWNSAASHHFSASGRATANSLLYLHHGASLPSWIQYDHTYNVHIQKSGTNQVIFYIELRKASNNQWTTVFYSRTDGTFTIPSIQGGYNYCNIVLRVSSGLTANESVYPYLIDEPVYHPRLSSQGIRYSPYWYSRNPFYTAINPNPPPENFGLPNCTCYAWGRFWEISDPNRLYDNSTRPRLSTGNGQDFFPHTQDGYTRGRTPQLGAIACYAGGNYSGLGHVCVLEQHNSDDTWTVSESAWNGYFFRAEHKILANGDYNDPVAGYTFQGFIYNPYAGDTDTPPYIEGSNFHLILAKRAIQRGKGELIL